MDTNRPNININLRRTLLIILGIAIAFLLSFGSSVIALNPQDVDTTDKLVTENKSFKEPAIFWHVPSKVSEELTSIFFSKLSELK